MKHCCLFFLLFFLSLCTVCFSAEEQCCTEEKKEQPVPFPGGSGEFKTLVWADEFEGTGLPDPNHWDYEVGYVRNRELQYYTKARLENTSLENGCLVITVQNDSFEAEGKKHEITSASVITRGKHAWKYGRIEIRAKVPNAMGTWPAIWMLPVNSPYGGWPQGGEIDILEHVGYDPDRVHFNLHTGDYNHTKGTGRGTAKALKDPHKDFHIYAVEWTEKKIDWYLNDQKVFTIENDGTGPASWPLDQPFYLILNLAYGGAWGGLLGVNRDALPQHFYIDYVRVFQ